MQRAHASGRVGGPKVRYGRRDLGVWGPKRRYHPRELSRVYGTVSLVSFALAVLLQLTSVQPAGSLARAFAPAPAATPATCAGLTLSGGHAGCAVLYQIVCRPSAGTITGGGLLGQQPVAIQVTAAAVALSLESGGDHLVLQGGPPDSFDVGRGAQLDLEVGAPGSADQTRVSGWVSCGF